MAGDYFVEKARKRRYERIAGDSAAAMVETEECVGAGGEDVGAESWHVVKKVMEDDETF